MTTLIAGTVEMSPESREQAPEEAAGLMDETRAQKGCVHYVRAADPTSERRIYVYEYWESTEDLAGPCYAQMFGLPGKHGAESAEVSKFRIDLEEPVYDPEGRPRADFFTG
jgi:quinol monooxygenase YgiN